MRRFVSFINKNTNLIKIVFLFSLGLTFPLKTWALSVSPVRIEFSGNPGESIISKIKVINTEPITKTYFTNIYNFEAAGDESGNPTFKVVKTDLATWVKVQDAVTLGPNESRVLPFSVSIPSTAEPGGYFAAIFLTENPTETNADNFVSLGSQVGSLLLLRVNGDIKEGADILEFGNNRAISFYNALPITFYYRFQNSGQDRVKPLGDIVIRNAFGKIVKTLPANKDDGNILPQSIRRFENTWGPLNEQLPKSFWSQVKYEWKNFAMGPYSVKLNLGFSGSSGMHGITAGTSVWVLPWQLMLVEFMVLVISFFSGRFLVLRYNRWIIRRSQGRKK